MESKPSRLPVSHLAKQYVSRQFDALPQVHASLASIVTIVSPCWVNLEAATCTAFTYNTHYTM